MNSYLDFGTEEDCKIPELVDPKIKKQYLNYKKELEEDPYDLYELEEDPYDDLYDFYDILTTELFNKYGDKTMEFLNTLEPNDDGLGWNWSIEKHDIEY